MALNVSLVKNVLMVIILLIITFQVLADTAEDVAQSSGLLENESATYPLTSFFKKKGVILLALMAGLAITIITSVLSFGKGK